MPTHNEVAGLVELYLPSLGSRQLASLEPLRGRYGLARRRAIALIDSAGPASTVNEVVDAVIDSLRRHFDAEQAQTP